MAAHLAVFTGTLLFIIGIGTFLWERIQPHLYRRLFGWCQQNLDKIAYRTGSLDGKHFWFSLRRVAYPPTQPWWAFVFKGVVEWNNSRVTEGLKLHKSRRAPKLPAQWVGNRQDFLKAIEKVFEIKCPPPEPIPPTPEPQPLRSFDVPLSERLSPDNADLKQLKENLENFRLPDMTHRPTQESSRNREAEEAKLIAKVPGWKRVKISQPALDEYLIDLKLTYNKVRNHRPKNGLIVIRADRVGDDLFGEMLHDCLIDPKIYATRPMKLSSDSVVQLEISDNRKALFKSVQERGFAMICTTDWLGLMVAPAEQIAGCPVGWIFLPSEELNEERFLSCLEQLDRGRKDWPEKSTDEKSAPVNSHYSVKIKTCQLRMWPYSCQKKIITMLEIDGRQIPVCGSCYCNFQLRKAA